MACSWEHELASATRRCRTLAVIIGSVRRVLWRDAVVLRQLGTRSGACRLGRARHRRGVVLSATASADARPATLRAGAARALAGLHAVARRVGRPFVLAELGYPESDAPLRPWRPRARRIPTMQRAATRRLRRSSRATGWRARILEVGSGSARGRRVRSADGRRSLLEQALKACRAPGPVPAAEHNDRAPSPRIILWCAPLPENNSARERPGRHVLPVC